jgi:hypothetical protein
MTSTINASTTAGLVQTADTSGVLALQTAGTTAVTVDASQNVGIGTASPTTKLTVGSIAAGTIDATYKGNIRIEGTETTLASQGGLEFKMTADGYGAKIQTLSSGGTNLAFATRNNSATWTERMRIDPSGNMGIGTSSPQRKLQSSAGADDNCILATSIAGNAYIGFADNGTTSQTGLSVRMGSAGNAMVFQTGGTTERMRIDSSGNLLVGKTSLGVATGFSVDANFGSGGSGARVVNSLSTSSSNGFEMYSTGTSSFRFYVGFDGTIRAVSTTITAISDQRLKENIRDLDDGLEKLLALKPRKFDWKENKGENIKNARGFIAQELELVFPDMISNWIDEPPEGEEPYKAVNANLIPTLVKAIQEQQALITQLQADVAALKGTTP